MSGPIIRNYKSGSIIYFEKDKAEDIYVLQKGRVILTYTSVNGHEMKEDVRLGEFFGVKSALGRYPREETAQVVADSTILVFKVSEFEKFVATKTHLIIKMLKVFSSQLRQVHRQLREILGQGEAKNPSYELMNVGEVFYKIGNYDHAKYVFQKYLEHYPNGVYANRAKELLSHASKNIPYPISMPPLVYQPELDGPSKLQEMLQKAEEKKEYTSQANLDPNSILGQAQKSNLLYNAQKYEEALPILRELAKRTDSTTQDEEKAIDRANYLLGMVPFQLGQYDRALVQLSSYIKNYSKGIYIKEAVYHLAVCTEKLGDKAKAKALYSKVVMLPPGDDSMTAQAKNKLKEIA